MKIYILTDRTHGRYWHEIDELELEDWKKDGSIEDGDLIIYPHKKYKAEQKRTVWLNSIDEEDNDKA